MCPQSKIPKILKSSKDSTFNSKMPVEAPIFTRNKLYQDDPNDLLYPLV